MSEMRGFIFALVFIMFFAGLLTTVPTDLQGQGDDPNVPTPLSDVLSSEFTESYNWTANDFSYSIYYYYEYELNQRDWSCVLSGGLFTLGAKIYYAGVIFLGTFDYVNFISPDGTNLGVFLSFTDIDNDAEEGLVQYDLQYETGGSSAGALVLYWNTTEYETSMDAFIGDELYFIHGRGIYDNAPMDITSLLITLITLQLPDCPLLINLLLATPVYACVAYLIWFFLISMIPFLGGS